MVRIPCDPVPPVGERSAVRRIPAAVALERAADLTLAAVVATLDADLDGTWEDAPEDSGEVFDPRRLFDSTAGDA